MEKLDTWVASKRVKTSDEIIIAREAIVLEDLFDRLAGVKTLRIHKCNSTTSWYVLVEKLLCHPHLSTLQLTKINIDPTTKEGLRFYTDLCELLKRNFTLRSLDLSGTPLGDDGCQALMKGFRYNTTLRILKLSNTSIEFAGVKILADEVRFNATLTTLDISKNFIRSHGPIVKILLHNHTLTHLDIRDTRVFSAMTWWGIPWDSPDQHSLSILTIETNASCEKMSVSSLLEPLLQRNRGLRKRCSQATLCWMWLWKICAGQIGSDIARFIGQMIWITKATRVWLRFE